MKKQSFFTVLILECYAILLAFLQHRGGIHTDEAKYLLDIPYPHPPLGRGLFHLLEPLAAQELILRILLATLLVQAVWLVWSFGRHLPVKERLAVGGAWLLSGGLLFQAGSIMLATITALEGLVLVWMYLRRDIEVDRYAGWLSIAWAGMLFTAFQSVLYLPLVVALFQRSKLPGWFRIFCVIAPMLLLFIYVLGHPLSAASFVLVQGDNAGLTLAGRLWNIVLIWGIAGSVWGSLLGILGILARKPGALFWTFALLSVYLMISGPAYSAILFLPLFVAGITLTVRRWSISGVFVIAPLVIGTALLVPGRMPVASPDVPKIVTDAITARHETGALLIAGQFGHEWQYASNLSIRRYRPRLLSEAQAIVCLAPCPDIGAQEAWIELQGLGAEVWVKK